MHELNPFRPPSVRQPRIAYVIPGLHFGGMERVLHDLARGLVARGFEIHIVLTDSHGRFSEGLGRVATLHQVTKMSRLSLLHPAALATLLRSIRPDILHSHAGVWLKASRAARLAGISATVHTDHGRPVPDTWTDRLVDRIASRSTKKVIAVSLPLAEVLRDRVVGKRVPIKVILNGVDTAQFRPRALPGGLRSELAIPSGAPVIGSVGRLEQVKNYRLALDAFAKVVAAWKDSPPPFLVLIGGGSERASLMQQAWQDGIASQVRFLGWRSDVELLYSLFDIFTLTSTSEGTSISLLEAMSSAICPVVTRVGGNADVLGPDLASHLVPSHDAPALAMAWTRLLRAPAVRTSAGTLARARVVSTYSLDNMISQYEKIYLGLLPFAPGAQAAVGAHMELERRGQPNQLPRD